MHETIRHGCKTAGNAGAKPFFFHSSKVVLLYSFALILLWGSKIWAHDLGPGTTFHQQYARGEEITEDRCN